MYVTAGYVFIKFSLITLFFVITERQKYISGVLRNVGFALMAPAASITFQWLVLPKGAFWEHFFYSVLVSFIGMVCLIYGFVVLKEKQ